MASIQTLTKEVERLEKENVVLKTKIEFLINQAKYISHAITLMQKADNHFRNVILEDMENHLRVE